MPVDAIVAAVAGALSAGATETGKKVVGDAYDGLKGLIKRKFGAESEAATALAKLEASPESAERKEVLKEELAAAGADADAELLAAVKELQAKLQELQGSIPASQHVRGDGNIQVIGHGVNISVVASGVRKTDG